jgi:selenocysteine lyase/cysteine desulfurase
VLVLEDQFPSNVLPWRQVCAERGGFLVEARREAGQDWTAAVLAALEAEPRISLLALPQVHWRDGALLDLDRIAAAARECDARLVLDLSQSLGALPVRLEAWQPEFVVSVGYKWLLGGYGLAWLWAAPGQRAGTALEQGWVAHDDDPLWHGDSAPQPLPGARRYDADGTCDALRLAMAEAGLRQVVGWSPARIAARLAACTDALDAALESRGLGGLRTPGHAPHLCGVRLPQGLGGDAGEARVRAALDAADIAATVHAGRVRIAPHLHVAPEEMARVVDALAPLA